MDCFGFDSVHRQLPVVARGEIALDCRCWNCQTSPVAAHRGLFDRLV
jgi:hypothetical protein